MKRNLQKKTQSSNAPKLVSFVGRSNSGKTTLLTKIIPLFKKQGLLVGTIKNTHHDVEFDVPGKDSWKYRRSGSDRTLVSSGKKIAIYAESSYKTPLAELVTTWFGDMDLVISEGFKNEECLKIEVVRSANNKRPLFHESEFRIDAIVSDVPVDSTLPTFRFDETESIVAWICKALLLPCS